MNRFSSVVPAGWTFAGLACVGLAVGCSNAPAPTPGPVEDPATAWRAVQPTAGPTPDLVAPTPRETTLANGLRVFVVSRADLPLVSLSVVVRAGSANDPVGLEGIAGFMGEAFKSGTKTRSAKQIAEEVESLGSSLHISVEDEAITLQFTALAENFAPIFDVLADVVLNPAFAADELERVRRTQLASLAQTRDDPRRTAGRVFRRILYGAHAYGHSVVGEEAALKKVDGAALRAFYEQYVGPKNAAVVVVGSLDEKTALEAVESRLKSWSSSAAATVAPQPPTEIPARVVRVDKKNAPQSQLRIGHQGVARNDPDYFTLVLLNAILGGQFNSRINMNLREDKGYTYGAGSFFDTKRAPGSWVVYSAVRTDVTGPAIAEVLAEVDTIRASGVSNEELQSAKSRYSLSLPGYFQTVGGIGGMVSNTFENDLPLDYYQQLPAKIAAVTAAEVHAAAKRYLQPEKLSIVVVGDKMQIDPGLLQLNRGPIREFDADATPVSPPQTAP